MNKIKGTMKTFVGWLLLILGVLIIGWGLFSSYKVFSASTEAPEIFKIEQGQTAADPAISKKASGSSQEEMLQGLIQEQLKEVIPIDKFLPRLLNLVSWSIFVGLLIMGGGKISLLGIRLIR